jgi:hypothetical protein
MSESLTQMPRAMHERPPATLALRAGGAIDYSAEVRRRVVSAMGIAVRRLSLDMRESLVELSELKRNSKQL